MIPKRLTTQELIDLLGGVTVPKAMSPERPRAALPRQLPQRLTAQELIVLLGGGAAERPVAIKPTEPPAIRRPSWISRLRTAVKNMQTTDRPPTSSNVKDVEVEIKCNLDKHVSV